ncbi:MAG: S46 family peptidase [Bacteroidetes bacterium]|nr:MAG: S46 family peptidase [Bacteroidota bacterium]
MYKIKTTFLALLISISSDATEGMWLPNLLRQYNESDMKKMGMKISADDIYNVNKNRLKDAVVHFGGGCTGEIVSAEGLLLTNHHCGYSQIQALSTIEKNYLENGYWASNPSEELPCEGLTASFIIEIKDFSQVMLSLSAGIPEDKLSDKIKQLSDSIEKANVSGTHYKGSLRSFYHGNQYFLFITEVFRDVRLVGAPPSSIGNFGGDTDNWMWPRHTGDFAYFRIYSGKDNKPADYSKDNVPFKPRKHFVINAGGVKEGDFTMVFGFPGRTQSYIHSSALETIYTQSNPDRIRIRAERLGVWQQRMEQNDVIELKYSSKYKSLTNHYKKWKGENLGMKKFNALAMKVKEENAFRAWTNADPGRKSRYDGILEELADVQMQLRPYIRYMDYYTEALTGVEIYGIASRLKNLVDHISRDSVDANETDRLLKKTKSDLEAFFKNYDAETDRLLAQVMIKLVVAELPDSVLPAQISDKKAMGPEAVLSYINSIYDRSFLTSKDSLMTYLESIGAGKLDSLKNDPAWKYFDEVQKKMRSTLSAEMSRLNARNFALQKKYMSGLMEMATEKNKSLYPDANSTLRVSYGKVEGFEPRDGIAYRYYTTLDGVIEKADPSSDEFKIPEKLYRLYASRDFGRFNTGGKVNVAFLASNHTTGGNSGSPVINGRGQLVGINFDRMWEGVMSDLYYTPENSRNISVDIRYVLFITEKLGDASWLIQEMDIVTK